jgi:stress-induced-phosphoprotein 1
MAGRAVANIRLDFTSEKFTQAIALEPENHILYSNRSAVYSAQNEYQKALEDAEKAITIKPDWSKGQLRKGAAYRGLGDLRK